MIYAVIAIAFVFLGAIFQNDLVWELTDVFNNLMVLPNAIALFALASWVTGKPSLPKIEASAEAVKEEE